MQLAWPSTALRWAKLLASMLVLSVVSSATASMAMVAEQADTGGVRIFTSTYLETIGGAADGAAGSAHWLDRERVFHEATKQAIDQPLHYLMAAGPIWLSHYATRAPWYGWSVVPVLVYREWTQWPSSRWWDPPLDAAVYVLGLLVATWTCRPRRRARSMQVDAAALDGVDAIEEVGDVGLVGLGEQHRDALVLEPR